MTRSDNKLRIVVLGWFVRGPIGGSAWCKLQYVLGLLQLGHEVVFLEDSGDYPACYDPSRHTVDADPTYGLRFAHQAFKSLGIEDWAYYDAHRDAWHGTYLDNIKTYCAEADLLINIGGSTRLRPWTLDIPRRIYVDQDPVFTQIRHLTDARARSHAEQHNVFLTTGYNVAKPISTMPDDGFDWQPFRQPVVLNQWPKCSPRPNGNYTTVMRWLSYSNQVWEGVDYGMKAETFPPYMTLPQCTDQVLEIALGSADAPRNELVEHGWVLQNPLEISRDLVTYQTYLQESKAEFSVAKHGYVVSRCGWFSERSANYLASGRPVILQDAGFSEWMEIGAGVLAFNNFEQALHALESSSAAYEYHADAARQIAETYFSSDKVLSRLIDLALID